MTRIERFGWRGEVAPGIGRVVSAHGDYYHLVCNEAEGEILARKKKSAFTRMKTAAPDDMKGAKKSEIQATAPLMPLTGDFVKFRYNAQGDSMILEVLPRFSHFERRDPTARRTSQTLAVNFDTLFVMMSLNEDFSTARIDRYLALAEDMGGGEAVVVLTKVDLRRDGAKELEPGVTEYTFHINPREYGTEDITFTDSGDPSGPRFLEVFVEEDAVYGMDEYPRADYSVLVGHSREHVGEKIYISGKVLDVDIVDDETTLLIVGTSGLTWDKSRFYVVDHHTGQNGYRIMQYDFVRVFGTLSGDKDVKFVSLLGSDNQNIPGIDAEQVFLTLNNSR